MSEFSGQVTHVEWSLTPLWLIPLLPFLGAVINAITDAIGHNKLEMPATPDRVWAAING